MNLDFKKVWERIQLENVVVLRLQPGYYEDRNEVLEALQQIRRGVVKAKTTDAAFRVINGDHMPKLKITASVESQTITFELQLRYGLMDIEPTAQP
jgi:hypothetical protein